MNGPSKSERDTLGNSIKRMEAFSIAAGCAVVLGVVVEVWPDIISCWSGKCDFTHSFPIAGGIVVALGVAIETVMASLISRKAEKIQELANREISQQSAEIERLRKENNDTLILRSYRSVGNHSAFEEAMQRFTGTKFTISMVAESNEVSTLQWELNTLLPRAGWISLGLPEQRFNLGDHVNVLTASAPGKPFVSAAADALAEWLDANHVAVLIGSVGNTEHEPGTVVIQLGMRSETIERYDQVREAYSARKAAFRPVTPPQA